MKQDELRLFHEFRRRSSTMTNVSIRSIVQEIGMNEKRAAYLCGKWARRGWYDYGVNILAGWLTETGVEVNLTHKSVE